MKKIFLTVLFSFFFFLFNAIYISAGDYSKICNDDNIVGIYSETYRKCGNNYIYIDPENKEFSSFLVSSNNAYSKSQIIYKGKIDGIDTFYSIKFRFFGIVHDERNFISYKGDYWTTISLDGVKIYDGKFKDDWFEDQSFNDRVMIFDETGTYVFNQYVDGVLTNTIKVILVDTEDSYMGIDSVNYGDKNIGQEAFVEVYDDIIIDIADGKYGYNNKVVVNINECVFKMQFNERVVVSKEKFEPCLIHNDKNTLSVTLYNSFNIDKTFRYKFTFTSRKLTIQMENSVSKLETSSRRILVNAKAGNGKTLNEKYSLYYWSTNPSDNLDYDSFMENYQNSEYRGSYSSSKGVILRNTTGTYYLYALAKDDDSTLVVRSDEYILKEARALNKIIIDDVIIVCILGLLAILPVAIYISIRIKEKY